VINNCGLESWWVCKKPVMTFLFVFSTVIQYIVKANAGMGERRRFSTSQRKG
jgi:hypothetical protein